MTEKTDKDVLKQLNSDLLALQKNAESLSDEIDISSSEVYSPEKGMKTAIKEQEKAIDLYQKYIKQKEKADKLLADKKEKANKVRNHRLIQIGAMVESAAGEPITDFTAFLSWMKGVKSRYSIIPGTASYTEKQQADVAAASEKKEESPAENTDTAGTKKRA